MFKINKALFLCQYPNLKLIKNTHNYNTRSSSKRNYFLDRKKSETGKKSFSFIGPKIWLDLSCEIKSCLFSIFKKKLKLISY